MDKDKREYYIYVRGKEVSVNEAVYKVYWREREVADQMIYTDLINKILKNPILKLK